MMPTREMWPNDIHVLIPSFQSAATLEKFLPKLLELVPKTNCCVVDDGSTDATDAVCNVFGISCLKHPTNRGKGAALATGFSHLLAQNVGAVITMDADGQHAIDELETFLRTFKTNPDCGIIIGRRNFNFGRMPVSRIFSNRITSHLLSRMTGVTILDSQSGYRLYSTRFLRSITIEYPRFEMESEVILKAAHLGFPLLFVPIQTLYLGGKSHISHLSDTIRWVQAVLKTKKKLSRKISSHPA
jgi:glycosyltransferase involved in cell wall biosynthesis